MCKKNKIKKKERNACVYSPKDLYRMSVAALFITAKI